MLLLACSRTTEFIGTPLPWNCGASCFRDENLDQLPQPIARSFDVAPDPVAANKPELRYPLPGSIHPINLPDLTLQWRSANGTHSYYRVRVASRAPGRAYDFYVPCRAPPTDPIAPAADECQYAMPGRAWEMMARENADGEVTVTIAAADLPRGVVATSEPVSLSFSPAAVEAGLYYFSLERTGVMRALVGAAAQPFILPTARFGCVGCHGPSRDGSAAAYVYERQYLGAARTDDPARPLLAPAEPPQPDAAMVALNPGGSLMAVSHQGQLIVRETATGREVARPEPAPAGGLYFPEWSPDGKELAVTQAARAENPYTVNDGSIVVLSWEGARFGAARTVVPEDAGEFHFYPSWSPDGAWIAFVSAPLPGKSYDNPQARLRLVSRAGDRLLDLGRASGGQGASWPKFAPVVQAGGNVYYLTFDSRLDYGYLLRNGADPMGGHPQLWLAAVDLRKLPGDPSSAPLWLPFQNLHVANVLGAWAERLACGPQSPCGDRARCDAGRCVRVPP